MKRLLSYFGLVFCWLEAGRLQEQDRFWWSLAVSVIGGTVFYVMHNHFYDLDKVKDRRVD